ncbi:LuxR family two component transcriptional regulator [Paraburkholderia silvatlantica]|uniref:LuxR family two component transcriptional regulator n=1 Tax=Paraburkholderia silvatlantica TaxID=321895 RepID=A0A2U1A0W9_9BURK|nr:LuxR family two component transcriptional regulator [Paraburkholderia silvatlantica]PXW30166.1 LuxR family two component transcriptional regulator [Paraburkholderia silvatlantica]PYE16733.1 LuxR family two component transcriptional regulator [Paraburkholderia silvatlantica]TDQ81906.1 LuxR family two component transcriptional regulator [Paraburkholderia silvatlantica]
MDRKCASPGRATQILIVDDHPIIRDGMTLLLNLQEDLHVCCAAGNAEEALAAMECRPDMAIVDISLQTDSGLELVKTLRHRYPDLAILVLSMHDESLFAERALRSGANGYLMKLEATEHVVSAIREVLAGNIYMSAAMHEKLARALAVPRKKPEGQIANLSEREFEVLHLIGLGFSTRDIAEKLNRSVKTIEAHQANIKEKLNIRSGKELTRFAIQWIESQ